MDRPHRVKPDARALSAQRPAAPRPPQRRIISKHGSPAPYRTQSDRSARAKQALARRHVRTGWPVALTCGCQDCVPEACRAIRSGAAQTAGPLRLSASQARPNGLSPQSRWVSTHDERPNYRNQHTKIRSDTTVGLLDRSVDDRYLWAGTSKKAQITVAAPSPWCYSPIAGAAGPIFGTVRTRGSKGHPSGPGDVRANGCQGVSRTGTGAGLGATL